MQTETALTSTDLPWLSGPDWPEVRVRVTTRAGGVSQAPYDTCNLGDHVEDDPHAVAANRARLAARLPASPVWLRQVHGTALWWHETGDVPASAPTADAAATLQLDQPVAVLTADCLPVVLATPTGVAVAHAGWRGLAAGVVLQALQALQARAPGPCRAWLGPSIGPTAFEVGDDVRAAFGGVGAPLGTFAARHGLAGKWWCDLPGLAAHQLRQAGVVDVQASGWCTVRDARFYSYRREGVTGRFATLVWRPSDLGKNVDIRPVHDAMLKS